MAHLDRGLNSGRQNFLDADSLLYLILMCPPLSARPEARSRGRELGPDVFLGDRAVDPLGDGDHAASAFELADDTGPLP